MIKQHPVPAGDSPSILRVIEPGEYNPMEVASAYRIWQRLDREAACGSRPGERGARRRDALFRIGARPKNAIPRETMPPDFDEEKSLADLKVYWAGHAGDRDAGECGEGRMAEAVKKRVEALRPEIVRRQAINLYVSHAKVRPVDPERLAKFIAALPPWIPPTFDSLSPDEARQRMTFAYRLVFPGSEEIGATHKPAGGASKARVTPAPKAGAPAKAKHKPAEDGEEAAPF